MNRDTKLIHLGRGPSGPEAPVNLPVHRASTILYPDVASYLVRFDGDRVYDRVTYGAGGTQNARALAEAVTALEGGFRTVITGSGLSAITVSLSALLGTGDHLLAPDTVYGPTRRFAAEVLSRYGVETTFYDPHVGEGIAHLIRDNTRVVMLEAPGSLTFEMQDVPAIARVARARGALSVMDNTWASPLFFRPLEHGVDVSIQAGTKYIAGHSDLVIGMVTSADEAVHRRIAEHARLSGDVAGPDDCYLTLRGLRTLAVRLQAQSAAGIEVAMWLAERPEVQRVLHPALPGDPGHALWRRDFAGAASLFGVTLHCTKLERIARMVDGLELFRIGSSWGGYESLVALNRTPLARDRLRWEDTPYLLRFHVGLEAVGDLIADLEAGLARLAG